MKSDSDPNASENAGTIVSRFETTVRDSVLKWQRRRSDGHVSNPSRPWIVAVSGGADSVALLVALARWSKDRKLIVAHMNHHARPAADEDEAFVKELAVKFGMPCEVGHWRPKRQAHFEVDARRARREWLGSVAIAHESNAIMTAHTQDDQTETVLMRLARGTGPKGMAGIRPWRSLERWCCDLVRPMLNANRKDVVDYLNALELTWRHDPTNDDVQGQTRAWVRHVMVPLIEERLNPRFSEAVARFAALQGEEQQGLTEWVTKRWNERIGEMSRQDPSLDLEAFRRFGPPWLRRIGLRVAWETAGLPQQGMAQPHWSWLHSWLMSRDGESEPKSMILPGGVHVIRSGGRASFRIGPPVDVVRTESSLPVTFEWPGTVHVSGMTLEARRSDLVPPVEEIRRLAAIAGVFDADRVRPPVELRKPRPGDRFDPIGLDGHHQSVADHLRTQGIKGERKQSAWLLADTRGIFWVVGHGVSERVKVTFRTQAVWIVNVIRDQSEQVDP